MRLLFFSPPESMVFSQFSFYLNSVQCQGLVPNLSSSFFTSASSAVSTFQTSPPNPLLPASVSTTFVQTTVIFQLVWVHTIASLVLFLLSPYKPFPTQATVYLMLSTCCRQSHVTLLRKHSSAFSLHLEISNSGSCSLVLPLTSSQTIFHWVAYSDFRNTLLLSLGLIWFALAGILFPLNLPWLATSCPSNMSSNAIASESSVQALINLN